MGGGGGGGAIGAPAGGGGGTGRHRLGRGRPHLGGRLAVGRTERDGARCAAVIGGGRWRSAAPPSCSAADRRLPNCSMTCLLVRLVLLPHPTEPDAEVRLSVVPPSYGRGRVVKPAFQRVLTGLLRGSYPRPSRGSRARSTRQ